MVPLLAAAALAAPALAAGVLEAAVLEGAPVAAVAVEGAPVVAAVAAAEKRPWLLASLGRSLMGSFIREKSWRRGWG